jgi:para-aminobenzoate synthetase component I
MSLKIEEIAFQSPINIFAKLVHLPFPTILDSSSQNNFLENYSYIAIDPFLTIRSKNNDIWINDIPTEGNPWNILEEFYSKYQLPKQLNLPPFQGGAVGYFGYELAQHLENLPTPKFSNFDYPDLAMGFYDLVIAFDHLKKKSWIFSSGFPKENIYEQEKHANKRINYIKGIISTDNQNNYLQPINKNILSSNFTKSKYKESVKKAIDYIYEGDIFQANISQTFSTELNENLNDFSIYLQLREKNPAPFSAFYRHRENSVLSSSPERFLKVTDGLVETRPIKGTRLIGSTESEDKIIKNELINSQKDRSENIMIVDLMRNDLSKVCKPNSISTPELCNLETYKNVHHLVSVVRGELKDGMTSIDLVKACFPGGSITGAPKIRAMEIIHELEPSPRGPYCGSLGYIAFNGDMDINILIRTITIHKNSLQYQVGGGIIAESNEEDEYQETLHKGNRMFELLSGNKL